MDKTLISQMISCELCREQMHTALMLKALFYLPSVHFGFLSNDQVCNSELNR